jgi:imidazolonepropionase-like amidohydrolase
MSSNAAAERTPKSMLALTFALALFASLPTPARGQTRPAGAETYEFINGQWFDGRGFRRRVFYSANGLLTRKKPKRVDEVVDLVGGYVVPPFGDAHNHFPESEGTLGWANEAFLRAGVFYVLNPNDIAELSNPIRDRLGTPSTIDVVFAHGGFTKTGGHPTALYQGLVERKILNYSKAELEGRAFYSVDSPADVEKKWPQFLATKPDFVKLYLLHSELYGSRDAKSVSDGLPPDLVAGITRRAKAAGLRSGAHIESAFDFHAALTGGVDVIMHLPGYHWNPGDTENDYLIVGADARLAARKQVPVVTTAALVIRDEKTKMFESERATQVKNLRRLKDTRVTILLGSDTQPGQGTLAEADYLRSTGVFSNLELLKMWCEATPLAIFPKRKIGYLKEGYEASFLVLRNNPLANFEAVKQIRLRFKQGRPVQLADR